MQSSTATASRAPSFPEGIRGHYQLADATMTLREGLEEYYEVNPGLSEPATIQDVSSSRYFHNHDCTHVVFGTHTGDLDEGLNDLLTLFGVNVRYRDYIQGFFATDESASISKSYATWSIFSLLWRTLKLVPVARRHCKAMVKKWPWSPPAQLLDRPLDEIRREYGIEIFRPQDVLSEASES